jgi:diaminopimelate epimerase
MNISFFKYQGTGNDFIIVHDSEAVKQLTSEQIKKICSRNFGIGGDGFIVFKPHQTLDFYMDYYNSDGKPSSMCGNGGRCMVQFAYDQGLHKTSYKFEAVDGLHEASFEDGGIIRLQMNDVDGYKLFHNKYLLNTGSPHYVDIVNDVMELDVKQVGKTVRYSKEFEPAGLNVNFVEVIDEDEILVRTYERGVEDETLSCGTGVTASALVCAHNDNGFNRVDVKTLGGKLYVEFMNNNNDSFYDIWLCGPAKKVFEGIISV